MRRTTTNATILMLFLMALSPALGSSSASCEGPVACNIFMSPEELYCCGALTCDVFRVDSSYYGGQCRHSSGLYCCGNTEPTIRRMSDSFVYRLEEVDRRGRRPFDGLRDGVTVELLVQEVLGTNDDGSPMLAEPTVVDRGVFAAGLLRLRRGGGYVVVAGDVFRLKGRE